MTLHGECITRQITDYPKEEQERMKALKEVVPPKPNKPFAIPKEKQGGNHGRTKGRKRPH